MLGATTQAVLEETVEIFDDQGPSSDEQAIIDLSERVSGKPMKRTEAEEYISDTHKLVKADATTLVDLSKKTALIDEEGERGNGLLFNSHTFRDGKYAEKAHRVLEQLKADERTRLTEVQDKLSRRGAMYEAEVEKMLEKHPGIHQAAVIPVPDELKGFKPIAFVVRAAGAAVDEEQIKSYALANAPAYQHPRRVFFVDEMPLAGTNKIDKRVLAKQIPADALSS